MKTIKFELIDELAFDDLVNLDCIVDRLYDYIKELDDPDDQRVVRSQLKTIQRLIVVYEDIVRTPDVKASLARYRSLVP